MSGIDVQAILREIDELLGGAGELPTVVEASIQKLLNVVEALCADKQKLADENQRLKALFEQKKRTKTTEPANPESIVPAPPTDHSSEERRRRRERRKRPKATDRRSFKDLTIHETRECPVDPAILPPDAVRLDDEVVIVQDIEIRPRNIKFQRQIFYSASQRQTYRGPLPMGYDRGDFGADLRALIIALKYCGNMSEPKIGEFLANFAVQVSRGSISNILTASAADFEREYRDLFVAGLSSTTYQQTDDTSARVKGQFWHTHILCNPYYTFYSTRPHKDRLAVLGVLQNTDALRFRFGRETLDLLEREFPTVPDKWRSRLSELGEEVYSHSSLKTLLDGWFGDGNLQLRTAIEHAAAIAYYRQQSSVPVVETLVCDGAGQFKLLTNRRAVCWIHEGRHYEKLAPVVGRHAAALESFRERFWDYYALLQDYRAGPSDEMAKWLRREFDAMFSRPTGYDALDARRARTFANREELLTVLEEPTVPLHNNASELGARVSARRRDVSLHSRSERGARAMDIFTTLVQTAKKLGQSAYAYLRDRLSGSYQLPSLAQSLTQAAASG